MSKDSGLDLIAVLVRNHREIEGMLGELERIPQSAGQRRWHAAFALARELVQHGETEAQCLYGAARKYVPDGDQLVEQDRRAWSDATVIFGVLADADPCRGRLNELIEQLTSWTRRHIANQEKELLAELGKHADRSELEWLGDRMRTVQATHANCSLPFRVPGTPDQQEQPDAPDDRAAGSAGNRAAELRGGHQVAEWRRNGR